MAKPKNTGLGRGLDAIFLDNSVEESSGVTMLRLSNIEPNPDQPRREFDQESLSQLAESIAAHGLIQPIVVRSSNCEGFYQIIAGERRWRASKMAGLSEVPVIIMELDDKKASQIAIIENIQREDLNPIEEAAAYKSLLSDHGMTQEELARQIGKSRSAISNTIRLLELPAYVLDLVKNGQLSPGHARALLGAKAGADMIDGAKTVIEKNLSVRDTELLVRKLNSFYEQDDPDPPVVFDFSKDKGVDYTAELAKKMTGRIGHRVEIVKKGKNKRIEIHFADEDELDDIVTLLCGENVFDD